MIGARKLHVFKISFGFTTAAAVLLMVAAAIAGSNVEQDAAKIVEAFIHYGLWLLAGLNIPTLIFAAGNGAEWLAKGLGQYLAGGARIDQQG